MFHLTHETFIVENHYITIPNRPPIEEVYCTVIFNIDDMAMTNQGFYRSLYNWIAQCCTQPFKEATFSMIVDEVPYCLLTAKTARGNQLALYCHETLCYTIGRSSAVVRDHAGVYDKAFSQELEQLIKMNKQLTLKASSHTNMKELLAEADFKPLQRYATAIDIAYMPKEKARHFMYQMTIACGILAESVKPYVPIPSLRLLAGKKGVNGFFDAATKTIGVYYKYDRDRLMQLSLFHEYGHFIDQQRQQNALYKKKRQHVYELLLKMPTLQMIQQDRSLTDEHRHYLLSIDEVMARLFESSVYYKHYGICGEKEFLFNEAEIKEASIC